MAGAAACRGRAQNAFVAHGPLPPPPAGPLKFAGTPPAHPFHKEAGNLYARTIFEANGPTNSHIEVRDLLIPPRGKSQIAALPGPAILELATGNATISFNEKPQAVGNTIRSLPAGTPVSVENPDAHPAMLRLYVIRAR
ncbi:MAG TPA: hypothetical protein VJN94_11025 [Candidatus Binataceae bacterium]|nr:hypothetical protein [Candidatus Binataceae bacterium]